MPDVPSTRLSLLVRLRDGRDQAAWADFVRLYAPAVYRFGRRKGLQDADAADLTQDVLRSVVGAIERHDSGRGSFRGWLFTLAHRRLYDLLARRRREPVRDAKGLEEQPDRADEERWNNDVDRETFQWAAERVRPTVAASTWQAFWQTAVEGESGPEVAAALGLTPAAVYLARGRVMTRIKAAIAELDEPLR